MPRLRITPGLFEILKNTPPFIPKYKLEKRFLDLGVILNSSLNESKQDLPLKEWVKVKRIDLDNQLIPKDVSLDVVDFEDFISKRQNYLKEKLKEIIGISGDGKNAQIESTQSQE